MEQKQRSRPQFFVLQVYGGTLQRIHGPLSESGAKNVIELRARELAAQLGDEQLATPDPLPAEFIALQAADYPPIDLLLNPRLREETPDDRRRKATEKGSPGFNERRRHETKEAASSAPTTAAGQEREIPTAEVDEDCAQWRSQGFNFNPVTGEKL